MSNGGWAWRPEFAFGCGAHFGFQFVSTEICRLGTLLAFLGVDTLGSTGILGYEKTFETFLQRAGGHLSGGLRVAIFGERG
jgi:hypothetical protein